MKDKEMPEEEMKKERNVLLELVKEAKAKAFAAKGVYHRLENDYIFNKQKYEDIDRKLAMLRRTILTPTGLGKKVTPTPPQLTIDQVKAIAKKLGIKIAEEENKNGSL